MQLKVLDPSLLVSQEDFVPVRKFMTSRRSIPPQVLPTSAFENFEDTTVVCEGALAMFLAGNVIFNTVGIGAISMFWGLVNSLQLIAYFPLLAIILPANSKIAYELTYSIAAFDLIPTDPISNALEGPLEGLDNTSNHTIHISEAA